MGDATKHFESRFNIRGEYLKRHFKAGLRARLAALLLGEAAIYNLFYDAAQVGWGIGTEYRDTKSLRASQPAPPA